MDTDQRTVVLRGGRVFRPSAPIDFGQSLVFRGERILAIGSNSEVAGYLASADEVVELDGRLVLPGFVDAHVHPVIGGIEMARCDLSEAHNVQDYAEIIARYGADHPNHQWVMGGGWAMAAFPDGRPEGRLLDELLGDRPAFFVNRDHHSAWVSSAALRSAGISSSSADPADGRIERDADGTPTGLLHEGAMELVERLLPTSTPADHEAGLRAAQGYLHSLGIVAWQDALVRTEEGADGAHQAYLAAADAGWLTARVRAALWWDRTCPADGVGEQIRRLAEVRATAGRTQGGRYRAETVKVMQDGVAETFTASLLAPYLDRCGHPTGNRGLSFLDPDLLTLVVHGLHAAGFQVHFHALGDRAVREVLDALDGLTGVADRRHQLAHLQIVDPADIGRFGEIGAIANLQPLWACHEPQMDELTIPFLGPERARGQYPFADLVAGGARIAMGSDWPVSSPDPILGLHTAVNRISPNAPAGTPALEKSQSLTLSTAITAYTQGSRQALALGPALTVGADADLVILDRDLFALDPELIHTARVHRTYVAGRLVHDGQTHQLRSSE